MNRWLSCLVGAFLGCAIVLSSAGAAWADGEIGLSRDGVTWSNNLDGPLLDPARRWVPGDSERASFFVRNQGPTGALLVISARSADTDELLAHDDVTLRARADGGAWVDLENGQASSRLTREPIAKAGVSRVEVDVSFDSAARNTTQLSAATLTLEVTLIDAAADGDVDDDNGGVEDDGASLPGGAGATGGGLLPAAGFMGSIAVLWIAAALVGIGLAVVKGPRREVRRG